MGVFDLRCALSGLSTIGPGDDFDCSIMLLEEVDGVHVPVLVPLSGSYDRYGRVEGDNTWLREIMDEWWDTEILTSNYRDFMEHHDSLGSPAMYFALAADSIFNTYEVTLAGVRVRPCIYRNDVAQAILAERIVNDDEAKLISQLDDDASIAVYADWLEQHGRPIQAAYERRHFARGIWLENADEFRQLIGYMESRDGFKPMQQIDGDQHSHEDLDQFAREAWDSGSAPIRALLQGWLDEQAAAAKARLPFTETAVERAYAATPVTLEMVAAIVKSPAIVAAIERSPERERVLEMLRASRPAHPALLSEIDGAVTIDGDDITVRSADGYDSTQTLAGRVPIVASGASVVAGAPLTEGSLDDLHQRLRILGSRDVRDRIVESLRPLLDLDQGQLEALTNPMFDHLVIEKSGHRVTCEQFSAWVDAGLFPHGDEILSSYAAIAAHRDPTFEAVRAEAERREDQPRYDPRAYQLKINSI